jgi:hypothetical protein
VVCPSMVISLEKQLRVGDLEREGEMGPNGSKAVTKLSLSKLSPSNRSSLSLNGYRPVPTPNNR